MRRNWHLFWIISNVIKFKTMDTFVTFQKVIRIKLMICWSTYDLQQKRERMNIPMFTFLHFRIFWYVF